MKYGNKKITYGGLVFDSKKEFSRYIELKRLESIEQISELQRQVKYVLIPSQRYKGKLVERECSYIADFVYYDNTTKEWVVEDVKGYRNSSAAVYAKFVIKRKLMLYTHGIRIKET